MDVRDLLELERALQRHRVVVPAPEEEEIARVLEDLCHLVHRPLLLQHTPQLVRKREHGAEVRRQLLRRERLALLSELERNQSQSDQLGGESLGRRDPNLRARVQVDAAVGLARDRRADGVADAQAEAARCPRELQRRERVGRLPRLRDCDEHVLPAEDRVAVAELRGVLDLARHPRQVLQQVLPNQARVVRGAARDHDDARRRRQRRPVLG
mmetsp:Transcript_23515/g.69444  ORF Transcript_23515/g.69444 Transcript_23515/m.69444 type:complete len:212 (+) Transcript_23515:460-1095(+)